MLLLCCKIILRIIEHGRQNENIFLERSFAVYLWREVANGQVAELRPHANLERHGIQHFKRNSPINAPMEVCCAACGS